MLPSTLATRTASYWTLFPAQFVLRLPRLDVFMIAISESCNLSKLRNPQQ